MNRNYDEYDHIKCTFTTPSQVLNSDGHIHNFRFEFASLENNYLGWYDGDDDVQPDYPCLLYGSNIQATPYAKCDYVTYTTGPYKSSSSYSYTYLTFYGLSTIPGGSSMTF